MLTGLRRLIADVRRRDRTAPRRLRVEPLESRTVLSVAGLGAPVFPAAPPPVDSLPALVDSDYAANLVEATHDLQAETAAERGRPFGPTDLSAAALPTVKPVPTSPSLIETAASPLPSPGEASHFAADVAEWGQPDSGSLTGFVRPGAMTQLTPASLSASSRFPEGLSTGGVPDHLTPLVATASLPFQPALVPARAPDPPGRRQDVGAFGTVVQNLAGLPIASTTGFSAIRADLDSVASDYDLVRWSDPGATSTDTAVQRPKVGPAAWSSWSASPSKPDGTATHLLDPQTHFLASGGYRETEGGFVSIEFVRWEPDLRPEGGLLAPYEHFIESPPPPVANGLAPLREPIPTVGDWLRGPVSHQQASRLVGLTLRLLPTSEEISLPSEGGFVELPAYNFALDGDWQVDWAGSEGADSMQAGAVHLTEAVTAFEAARNDASSTAVVARDSTRPLAPENTTEGGFVDVGTVPDTLPSLSGRCGRISTGRSLWDSEEPDMLESVWENPGDEEGTPFWNSEAQHWGNSIWRGLGKEDEPAHETGVAEDDDPQIDEQSAAGDDSDEAAQGVHWAFHGEEGGMIELAAAFPGAASSASVGEELSLRAKGIRMDKGVGRFQAFELATVPPQYVDEFHMTAAERSEPVQPAVETASMSTSDAPTAEASASASRERSEPLVHRAAALPTIVLLASLATAIDAASEEEVSRFRTRRSQTS